MAWERILAAFVAGISPMLPQLSLIFLAVLALICPILAEARAFSGSGPLSTVQG